MLILPDHLRRGRLISDEYREQQVELHKNPSYGHASSVYAELVARVVNKYEVGELLDYGAGKGLLAKTLSDKRMIEKPLRIQQYDPAIPEWAGDPEPCDMVACIDVLEHIEPSLLFNVLDDLQRVTKRIGAFTVSTVPAIKTLADGRNAHLIVQDAAWWLPKLMERFDLHAFQKMPDGFFVLMMAQDRAH